MEPGINDLIARPDACAPPMVDALRARSVAHDLRNVLAIFSAGISLLERSHGPTARSLRIFDGLRDAVSHGNSLVSEILGSPRTAMDRREKIGPCTFLSNLEALIAGALPSGIECELECGSSVWPVEVDPTSLKSTVLNLVVNAAEAMPEGGVIRITAKNTESDESVHHGLSGNFVKLEVRDDGEGIPAELLKHVLEPCFTTKSETGGTGLGLTQVQRFVAESNGHFAVETHEGTGTTMIIYLPAADVAGTTGGCRPAGSTQSF